MAKRAGLTALAVAGLALSACSSLQPVVPESPEEAGAAVERARNVSLFGPPEDFHGSPLEDVGRTELYPVRGPEECEVAVLDSGEGSFAARLDMLRSAQHSIASTRSFG